MISRIKPFSHFMPYLVSQMLVERHVLILSILPSTNTPTPRANSAAGNTCQCALSASSSVCPSVML